MNRRQKELSAGLMAGIALYHYIATRRMERIVRYYGRSFSETLRIIQGTAPRQSSRGTTEVSMAELAEAEALGDVMHLERMREWTRKNHPVRWLVQTIREADAAIGAQK